MTKPKATDPLTIEEITKAADIFFPLFTEVSKRMPMTCTTEDKLKVMESVCSLAQKLRATAEDESVGPFGFNKKDNDGNDD